MLATDGWDDRAILAQKFTWNDDSTPNFGQPIPLETALQVPAGEPCGQIVLPASVPALSGSFTDTGESLINTLGSFSVATWVRLDTIDQPIALLSQDGGFTSNFVLGYADNKFIFTLFDSTGKNPASAVSSLSPEVGTWYHLVGVHDMVTSQALLYVNGELQASTAFTNDWDARGHTILGAARRAIKRVDMFFGVLADVRFYRGALDAGEISEIPASKPGA